MELIPRWTLPPSVTATIDASVLSASGIGRALLVTANSTLIPCCIAWAVDLGAVSRMGTIVRVTLSTECIDLRSYLSQAGSYVFSPLWVKPGQQVLAWVIS